MEKAIDQMVQLQGNNLVISYSQMDWVFNLCNCFSPEMRRNIIGYLSASNLNRQVIQEEKCTQSVQQDNDSESIYHHVKQRSYYSIQYVQAEDIEHAQEQSHQSQNHKHNQLQFENELEPSYYPAKMQYDDIFLHKLKVFKHILETDIDENYHKVYDSQDQNHLLIWAKNQITKGKSNNVYRFQFSVPNSDQPSVPKDLLQLVTVTEEGKSLVESLLKHREIITLTPENLEICYRTYQKKLVISQHDFVTAEKTVLQEQLDDQLSTEGQQFYNQIVYSLCFSVNGTKDEKSVVYNRGKVHLCGIKASMQKSQKKTNQSIKQNDKENSETTELLKIQGYINVQLDTTVNPNMLKQPVAKEIRTYAQKLICLLQKSDAI